MSDTIRIYEAIGCWGISAADIVNKIEGITGDLTLYINSPGGDVFEALTIMNALRESPAKVTAVVEGVAASAASVIAVGGSDRLIMRPGAELMIHDAWTDVEGDAAKLSAMCEQLERTSDSLAKVYAAKAGGDPSTWREAMRRESWYSADEAVAAGLADAVEDGRVDTPAPKNAQLLKLYAYSSRAAAPPPPPETIKKDDMTTEIKNEARLLQLLEKLLVKLVDGEPADEAPAEEPANEPDTPDTPTDNTCHCDVKAKSDNTPEEPGEEPDEGPDEEDSTEALTIQVDREAFTELRELAEYGRAAKARDEARAREEVVDDAIASNKIAASARSRWIKAMTADEAGTREVLAAIEPNTIPRAELGHALDPDAAATPTKYKPYKFPTVNV